MHNIILLMAPRVTNNLLIAATLFISLFNPVLSIASESSISTPELTFLTWGDYINKEVVAEFEAKYEAKVNFIYYDSDDGRDEILMASEAEGYDLILLNSPSISSYQKLNWITPFNVKDAPNINNLKLPGLYNSKDAVNTCAPYFWGSTGIAYRKDLVPESITSWKQIFDPAPELQGKILMSTTSEEVVGMALKSLGYSMSSSSKKELEQARQLLLTQAPSVAGYSSVVAEVQNSKLVAGEVSVIQTYNIDALMLQDFDPRIEYVLPKEGGAIWVDYICLSAKANNTNLAHQFINFINQPEQAANNALYLFAATPNQDAEKFLPAEFLNNPLIYPNTVALEHSEIEQALSPRTIKIQNSIMNELNKH